MSPGGGPREATALNHVIPRLRDGDGWIVSTDGGARTQRPFAEVYRDVIAVVRLLEGAGVRPGDRVGLWAQHGHAWLCVDLACLALGCVSVPIDRAQGQSPAEVLARYPVRLLFTDHPDAVVGTRVVPLGSLRTLLPPPASALQRSPHRFAPEEGYTVKLTSGTSARSKGVDARALHFDHMALHIQRMFRLSARDTFLALTPLSVYLQRFLAHLTILAGGRVALGRMVNAPAALRVERPTVVIGVPQLLESTFAIHQRRLKADPVASLRTLYGGRIRCLWTGSAPIARETLEAYAREGVPVYEGYGMTETGMIAKNFPGSARLGSVGRPFPDKQVELGPEGQVVVRSRYHANDGYWIGGEEDDEEGSVFLDAERVATGDVGFLDGDGFLHLQGRVKDAIALQSGHKVFPSAIEERLRGTGRIGDCVVVGQGKPYLVAVVTPATEQVSDAELEQALGIANQALLPHQRVLRFLRAAPFTVESGLRTSTGKLSRRRIHEHFADALERLYRGEG